MHALNLYKTEAIDTLAWPVVENTITVNPTTTNLDLSFIDSSSTVFDLFLLDPNIIIFYYHQQV